MRWIERFVKFSVEQGDATSFEGLRTRFCESLATARSVTPWVLKEISAGIDLLLRVVPPAELSRPPRNPWNPNV